MNFHNVDSSIDGLREAFPNISNPIKIYRQKNDWKIVVSGKHGLHVEVKKPELEDCFLGVYNILSGVNA